MRQVVCILRSVRLVSSALFLAACGGMRALKPSESAITGHAVFISNSARPLEPRVGEPAKTLTGDQLREIGGKDSIWRDTAYHRLVGAIIDSIRADSIRRGHAPRLLLRIHGGLNSLDASLKSTVRMTEAIRADSATDYYPLFVNWESGMISAYGDHLLFVRRGLNRPAKSFEWVFSPAYLAADLGAGIARTPLTIAKQVGLFRAHGFRSRMAPIELEPLSATIAQTPSREEPANKLAQQYARAVDSSARASGTPVERMRDAMAPPHGGALAISRFEYRRTLRQAIVHHGLSVALSFVPLRYWLNPKRSAHTSYAEAMRSRTGWGQVASVIGWLPPKTLGLVVIDGLGPAAWENMRRRTKLMMRGPLEFEAKKAPLENYVPPLGPLATLMNALDTLTQNGPDYRITLVGHSMGAIVATEILREYPRLRADNIVFLAPATSVREFEGTVVPFMRRNPGTEFYNVTLHPWAEQREWNKGPVLPYGSLLEWIDAYFGSPEVESDRMLGKFTTATRTAGLVPQDLRGRVHIKAMGYQSGKGCGKHDFPYKHGQFNEPSVLYWRSGFWHPGSAGCEQVRQSPQLAGAPSSR